MPKKIIIRDYFSKTEDPKFVKCKLCKEESSYHARAENNLIRHIKFKHNCPNHLLLC